MQALAASLQVAFVTILIFSPLRTLYNHTNRVKGTQAVDQYTVSVRRF